MSTIVFSSRGSRGDVLPIIELAQACRQRHHQVRICVPTAFVAECRRRNLPTVEIGEDSFDVMQSFDAGWQAARQALGWFSRDLYNQLQLFGEVGRGADLLVTSVNELAAPTMAEYLRIPHVRIAYAPILPGDQPPPLIPWQGLPSIVNRLLWKGLNSALAPLLWRTINRQRRRLGLSSCFSPAHYFAGKSTTVLDVNACLAPPSPLWRRFRHTYSGYCFTEEEQALPDEVLAFIHDGSPPLYFGLGSVRVAQPALFTEALVRAVKAVGGRAIISRGWTKLGMQTMELRPSRNILYVEHLPHHELFPMMGAVIHHGGSGTVHMAARAGVPQLIMPQIADQYYWGARIEQLGLGPAPLAPNNIDVAQLAIRLQALQNGHQQRAEEFTRFIKWDKGIPQACRAIERALEQ